MSDKRCNVGITGNDCRIFILEEEGDDFLEVRKESRESCLLTLVVPEPDGNDHRYERVETRGTWVSGSVRPGSEGGIGGKDKAPEGFITDLIRMTRGKKPNEFN